MKYLYLVIVFGIFLSLSVMIYEVGGEGVWTDDDPTSEYYNPYVPYPKTLDRTDKAAVIEYNQQDKINHFRKSANKEVSRTYYTEFKLKELEARIEKLENENTTKRK